MATKVYFGIILNAKCTRIVLYTFSEEKISKYVNVIDIHIGTGRNNQRLMLKESHNIYYIIYASFVYGIILLCKQNAKSKLLRIKGQRLA